MSPTLVKYQFTRYFFGLIIFDAIIFLLNEIIPFLIYLMAGKLNDFSFINHIGSVVTYLSLFTFFYIISTYGGYFKLGMQNSLPRNNIWRSQLISNMLVVLIQTIFTMLINFAIIMPFQRISNRTTMYQLYNQSFHNRILSLICEFVINYLSILLIVALAMVLATFVSLFIKRFRKWIWTLLVIIFVVLFIFMTIMVQNYSYLGYLTQKFLKMIAYAFGLILKVNNHRIAVQSFNPINLIITLIVIDMLLFSIGHWLNNHLQIKKLL